jgi:hypothetical protein
MTSGYYPDEQADKSVRAPDPNRQAILIDQTERDDVLSEAAQSPPGIQQDD